MRAQTSQPVHEIIATRRSPRSLDGTAKIEEADLLAVLEAGRWAPSANNGQPWRFIVARPGDESFEKMMETLNPTNASWAKNSLAFIFTLGKTTNQNGEPYADYQFDCGLAVAQMSFEIHHRGFVAHQMAGYDKVKAREAFEIPSELVPLVIIAIGKQDSPDKLEGALFERETATRVRKPMSELVISGL